ncbi:MAG: glycosyl transferase [marine bacterium B5-7]|nr:MAG: glycosyl transferase [marine bacterium B5-7]
MDHGGKWPLVTIVTPSYNQGQYLEETIRSVLLQGYPNIEYIVNDGGSTDNSVDIIRKYEKWLCHWVSESDNGQSHAINNGFKKGTGDIFAWLNSDDIYKENALKNVVKTFIQNSDVRVAIGQCIWVDQYRSPIRIKKSICLDPVHFLRGGGGPGQPGVFFHQNVLRDVGLLDECLHYVMDWDYWIRIGLHYEATAIRGISALLAEARIWEGIKSVNGGLTSIKEREQVLDKIYRTKKSRDLLHSEKRKAYSDLHWRRARWYLQHGKYVHGSVEYFKATILNPNIFVGYRRLRKIFSA